MKNGKQPQKTRGLFPLFYAPKNISKIFASFFTQLDSRMFFAVSQCRSLFASVEAAMLNKASFCVDRVYGFVCLLIFQVRGSRIFFFTGINESR